MCWLDTAPCRAVSWRYPVHGFIVRVVLRIVAIVILFEVAATVLLLWRLLVLGGIISLGGGMFGVITISGWALTLVLGPFAAVQLWRLQESGRRASLILPMYALLYLCVSWLFFRQPGAHGSQVWLAVAANGLMCVLLLSPPARRICQRPAKFS